MTLPTCDRAPRSAFELLRDRNFGPYFAGKLASTVGIWFMNVGSAILVYDVTRSATFVGAVSIAQFLPQLLFAPWAGALTDRIDRRLALGLSLLVSGFSAAGLAIYLTVVEELSGAGPVLLASLAFGSALVVSSPAMLALIPALVPRRELGVAIALNSTTASISRAVGPAAGAGLYAAAGPQAVYWSGAAGHLLFALSLLWLRTTPRERVSDRSLFGGFSYVSGNRTVLLLLVCVAAIGLTVDPVITLSPPLAELLGAGQSFVGILASAFGVGAFVGIGLFRWLQQRSGIGRVGVTGFVLMAVGNLALSTTASTIVSLAGMCVAGSGFLLTTSSLTTRIQLLVPDQLRGRVMALWGVAFLGTRPLAAGVNGLLADHVSVSAAFVVTALVAAASGLLLRCRVAEGAT